MRRRSGALRDWLQSRIEPGALAAIGHRVMHDGPKYWQPTRITPKRVEELRRISPFVPEHLPEEILLMGGVSSPIPEASPDCLFRHRVSTTYRAWRNSCRANDHGAIRPDDEPPIGPPSGLGNQLRSSHAARAGNLGRARGGGGPQWVHTPWCRRVIRRTLPKLNHGGQW